VENFFQPVENSPKSVENSVEKSVEKEGLFVENFRWSEFSTILVSFSTTFTQGFAQGFPQKERTQTT
jgi:hypothetical protein